MAKWDMLSANIHIALGNGNIISIVQGSNCSDRKVNGTVELALLSADGNIIEGPIQGVSAKKFYEILGLYVGETDMK
jgi:hypothetical protein